MIEELFSMPLPDRYGRVLTLRADQGLYDDVHLMLIQAWLHLQMYEEYGALELLLRVGASYMHVGILESKTLIPCRLSEWLFLMQIAVLTRGSWNLKAGSESC